MVNIFMGSGFFAFQLFELLHDKGFEIQTVVTRPDRPSGRGLHYEATPVKVAAGERGIPVLEYGDLKGEEKLEPLRSLVPDFILVADFGLILPEEVLGIPVKGCINVHPSLLPRYRGSAPMQRALMDGAEATGVTLILMDKGMDTGPIVSQTELKMSVDENLATLCDELAHLAAEMVMEALPRFASGEIAPMPQDPAEATYAAPISKSDLVIDWSSEAPKIRNHIRALSPRPGAFSCFRGKRTKILAARTGPEVSGSAPGEIAEVAKSNFDVACLSGSLTIESVQPEGKKVMAAAEFIRGYRPQVGETFKEPHP
ncbi:MAG: methionyl-tRNA formyltransferase [Actinobacteria bacterium RBG_19FT_COMBO_54_7]|uniref:Methionyl-tRNA formyltransferase n=1 Tax=Candidatus Solincola sediminis TaxID=1797199 RepID=A0A1F2WGJ0_9ACTN|nr:MAG: methionyl-tRNA formyltransferase [Candidatus Solincola sediminis]OFW56239.1 MAG: methionyl-tRNA formyltransferase [Candidatus Solincola sediminis]OFW70496.1 MAG: methionyl-tRNA formyltransferase [Actinobacteria bacterium RBG_19FT_COMBO_54_7]